MRRSILPVLLLFAACGGDSGPMVYVALDEDFSRPVLERFAKELGFPVRQRHDTEGAKTVGLYSMIREEESTPRCSVFWNNEIAHTAALAEVGQLEPYASPAAADLPAQWRDPQGRWTGFAARARILIVNTELLPDEKQWPKSYKDLVDPKWKGRCAVAKPKTGTTLTHFTALHRALGQPAFDKFVDGMFANEVRFLSSNGATMKEVRDGKIPWAFTDTDDYHVAKLKGFKVACVFPDQEEGGLGTMVIPNSVGIVKGGPDLENAKKLVDKIVSRETEALLAAAESAQMPLRAGVPGPKDPAIKAVGSFRMMAWDVATTGKDLAACSAEFGKRWAQ